MKNFLRFTLLLAFLFTNEIIHAQLPRIGSELFPDTAALTWKGKVKKGSRNGEWKATDKDKHVLVIATYTKGVLNGRWETYYINGALRDHGMYVNGKRSGVWIGLLPGGDSAYVASYEEGMLHGHYHDFYSANRLRSVGTFHHGKKEGRWEFYQLSYSRRRYNVEMYVNDTLHGVRQSFYNDKLTQEETYVHGKKNGPFVEYDDKGNVARRANYTDDLADGPVVKYYQGDTSEFGAYTRGARSGYWELRDRGRVITRIWYGAPMSDTRANIKLKGPGNVPVYERWIERPDSMYRYRWDASLKEKNYFRDTTAAVWEGGGVREVREYYEDTALVKSIYTIVMNSTEGPVRNYYRNGQVSSVVIQSGRDWNGPAVWYHNNGALRARDTLENSMLSDGLKLYDRKGKVIAPTSKNYEMMKDSLFLLTPGLRVPVVYDIVQEGVDATEGDFESVEVLPMPEVEAPDEIFMFAEEMPSFPGGTAAYMDYLQKNLKYPEAEKDAGVEGTVYIQFDVAKDGSIQNVVTLKGIPGHPAFEREAMRVLRGMPAWTPGKMNGRAVAVRMTMPVKFVMRD